MSVADGLVSGRYEVRELLGSGGSAAVYAAVDLRTGDRVALKILHPRFSADPAAIDAFRREATAALPLRQANVARVIAVGVHDAGGIHAWIAFELAPGSTLAELVSSRGPLEAEEALAIGEGVLRALAAAHALGLVHRDLTPSNLMVAPGPGGEIRPEGVKLLDFGLADRAGRPALGHDVLRSRAAEESAAGALHVVGSADYVSPEHALGQPVDERSDLYQLAAVLHFALTGAPPFARGSAEATLRAHVQSPPPVPSATRPGVPPAVDRLVVRGLLKAPGARFASAGEMLDAVRAARPGSPSQLTAATDDRAPSRTVATASRTRGTPQGPDVTAVLPAAAATAVLPRSGDGAAGRVGRTTGARRRRPTRGGRAGAPATWAVIGMLVLGGATAVLITANANAPGPVLATSRPSETTPPPDDGVAEAPPPVPPAEQIEAVAMPELAGMTLEVARSTLADAGLLAGQLSTEDSPFPGDTVLRTGVAAGVALAPGAAVPLVIASGSNRVPEVEGMSFEQALELLQAAGFSVEASAVPVPASQIGVVIGVLPGPGERVRLGSSIAVSVGQAMPRSTPREPAPPTTEPPATGTPPPTEDVARAD